MPTDFAGESTEKVELAAGHRFEIRKFMTKPGKFREFFTAWELYPAQLSLR
jgi:hypothetical protein